MSKVLRTIGEVAVAVVVGIFLGPQAGFAVFALESTADSLIFKPKAPGAGFSGSQLTFTGALDTPVPYVLGRTGFAGTIVKEGSSGDKPKSGSDPEKPNYYIHYVTTFGLGPIAAIEKLNVAQTTDLAFDGGGACTTSPYAGFTWQATQLGGPLGGPYVAMTQPAGSLAYSGAWSAWSTDHKLSSLAAAWWILAAENPPFESGTPSPLWTIQGVLAYDPRLDSTQTGIGGSGTQRANDETTWAYSENPYVHAITYALGRYRAGRRVIGIAAPMAAIDVAAFANGANVADANGWKVGGVIASTDSKWTSLQNILQAGGGAPLQLRAQLSCVVQAPRTSIATVTASDLAGVPQIAKTASRRDRFNQVIPTYRSEDHGWQQVAAEPIVVADYVTIDGGELRSKEITYTFVQNAAGVTPLVQVAQLARYDIEASREIGPVVLPLRASWIGIKPGDCITADDPALRLSAQKLVVTARTIDPSTGAVTLTCTGETDAKHTAALAQTGTAPPVPPPS